MPDGEASMAVRDSRPMVVLVGPMCAGKSTVGAELAARWGVDLLDTDDDIEAVAGKPVSEIFVDDGEEVFRELERTAVARALVEHTGVVAVGGGAVVADETRSALGGHRVVFLDVGLSDAASRVGLGATRPVLLGNVRGQLKALLDARRPLYDEVATVRVLTDGRTVAEIADEIEKALA
jgi:shikimate kinase